MRAGGRGGPAAVVLPMRRVLRRAAVIAAIALPAATLLGWLVAGVPGAWGAALGIAIAVGFLLVTVATALATAGWGVSVLGFAVLGSWLVKVLLLMGVLAVLRDLEFYSRPVLLVSLLVGAVGTLLVEAVVATRTRVPYVEPTT